MLPIRGALRGRRGLTWLDKNGSYAVVANRRLHRKGMATKFAVANAPQGLVASVHRSLEEAMAVAQTLSQNEPNKRRA